jgi:hypothetical protein
VIQATNHNSKVVEPCTKSPRHSWRLGSTIPWSKNTPPIINWTTSRVETKKIHKTSKDMATVLSNLTNAMCHAFIHDKSLLPSTPSSSSKSSEKHTRILDENVILHDG